MTSASGNSKKWPRQVPPYNEDEATELSRIMSPDAITVIKQIEELEFDWVLTDHPFPPGLGRRDGNEPIRPWSVPRQTAWLLYSFAMTKSAKTIVEIGTSFGYSTIWLASAVAKIGGSVHTVEAMPQKIEYAQRHFAASGLQNIVLHSVEAHDFCNAFSQDIDLLFLDADATSYMAYWSILENRMKSGSILIADNVQTHPDQIGEFVKFIQHTPNMQSVELQVDNGLLVATRS